MVEVLLAGASADAILDLMDGDIAAPYLIDMEVLSVLRGLLLGHQIDEDTANEAIANFRGFKIERHPERDLVDRVWSLRHEYTTYDASYIALAETLECPLITCDKKLTGHLHHADVKVFGQ